MGVLKWIARKGAVGGTARWAAKVYLVSKQNAPSATLKDRIDMLTLIRYNGVSSKDLDIVRMLTADELPGVSGLVVSILIAEAGFLENSEANKRIFFDTIAEELRRLGLSEYEIFGQ